MQPRLWWMIQIAWIVAAFFCDYSMTKGGVRMKGRRTTTTTEMPAVLNQSLTTNEHDDMEENALAEVYNSNGNKESLDTGDDAVCVAIPKNMTLCRGIGYTQMRLPNLLHHSTLDEVSVQASSWSPLLATKCHPDVQLYLCSLFSPVCLDQPIWPCRSLCERVKEGCEPTLRRHGFPWPDMLRCDTLSPSEELCIAPPQQVTNTTTKHSDATSTCSACQSSVDVEDLQKNYCAGDFAAKIKLEDTVLNGSVVKITAAKKVKFYKQPNDFKPMKKRQEFYLMKSADCHCNDLENRASGAASHFVLIGKMDAAHRLNVTFVYKYNLHSDAARKAMRLMTRRNQCSDVTLPTTVKTEPQVTAGVNIKLQRNMKTERLNKKKEKIERKLKKRQELRDKKILHEDQTEEADHVDRKTKKDKKAARKNGNENARVKNNQKINRNRKMKRVKVKKMKGTGDNE